MFTRRFLDDKSSSLTDFGLRAYHSRNHFTECVFEPLSNAVLSSTENTLFLEDTVDASTRAIRQYYRVCGSVSVCVRLWNCGGDVSATVGDSCPLRWSSHLMIHQDKMHDDWGHSSAWTRVSSRTDRQVPDSRCSGWPVPFRRIPLLHYSIIVPLGIFTDYVTFMIVGFIFAVDSTSHCIVSSRPCVRLVFRDIFKGRAVSCWRWKDKACSRALSTTNYTGRFTRLSLHSTEMFNFVFKCPRFIELVLNPYIKCIQ